MDLRGLFETPCFVINMDRSPDRWATALQRIRAAGFQNICRWRAVDGSSDDLSAAWASLIPFRKTSTPFEPNGLSPGMAGCALSHLLLWKYMCDHKIERAVVFEDDVVFHERFSELAPDYAGLTPEGWNMLFLGAQPNQDFDVTKQVVSPSVYCTHAYVVTREGAHALLCNIMSWPRAFRAIDNMITEIMRHPDTPLRWYLWNAYMHPSPMRKDPNGVYEWRNCGLVFQDWRYATTIGTYI